MTTTLTEKAEAGIPKFVSNLKEVYNSKLGYKTSVDDEFDISKQLERIEKEEREKLIANQRYLLAEKKLRNYMIPIMKVLRNGFQELPEPNKKDIIKKVSFKIKDIASSTGLHEQKRNELTEEYIMKVERVHNHPYLADSPN